VAALRGRDADAAVAVMDHHLGLVEHRALSDQGRDRNSISARCCRAMPRRWIPARCQRSRACRDERQERRNDRVPDFINTSFIIHGRARQDAAIKESIHDQASAFAPHLPRRRRRQPVHSLRLRRPGRRPPAITVGIVYVGSARITAGTRRMPVGAQGAEGNSGRQVVEEENVPETVAVAKPWSRVINIDGATLLFPTSFGYFNPFMVDAAKNTPRSSSAIRLRCGRPTSIPAMPAAISAISTRAIT